MTFAAALRLGGDPLLLLGLGATVLAASFALLPGRAAPLLVGVLAVLFVGESAAAAREVATAAAAQQARLLGPEPRWVDRAGSGPVAVLYGGTGSFDAVWENAFWNRRIAAVYDLPGAHVLGPMPQHTVTVGRDGTLRSAGRPLPQPYAVLPSDVTPAGARIVFSPLAGSDIQGLALWRLERPARLLERRVGFLPNGDIPYSAELREFGCARGGTFLVTLLGKVDTTVEVYLNGRRVADVDVAAGEAPTHVVHAGAAADGSCTLWLKPATLVGTTEARFARG
jgi:hypothetical protein